MMKNRVKVIYIKSSGVWRFFTEIEDGKETRIDDVRTVQGVRVSQRARGLLTQLLPYGITKEEFENAILEELERHGLDSSEY